MITNKDLLSQHLLQSKAIKLDPANPFTWASGWKSPIYCDNRKTLSFPEIRRFIRDGLVDLIRQNYDEPQVIAGVATGAIAQGALVAEAMDLPFVYVRPTPKSHGLENLIEGELKPGQKVLVVEDLISTGGSSLKAVQALREAGAKVAGMVAIFSYGFPEAEKNFKSANCSLYTLGNYETLVEHALATGYINAGQKEILVNWRKDPSNWMK
jgi:orotate phosphoribosyltransferase